ncbi:hypothetical protein GBAR_LOCUS29583 [Geodia barretti]|uniref:Peptidase C14 caspase domain-containing protein n=1 Tax=Geodia barretti TaxID=519541 RepID=A0AA35TUQ4_GEOBA|nr:hypothetical protein GBAR_LOCUS29583 [Geodia barretti]
MFQSCYSSTLVAGGEILFTKKGGNKFPKNQAAKSADEVYFTKGMQHVEGNYCIAYATIPHHVSYASNRSSVWMPKLARALREMNDSFQDIAATVMKEVRDSLKDNPQQCDMVNRLNCGPLMLRKYLAVQEYQDILEKALKGAGAEKRLLTQFKKHGWVDQLDNMRADELITNAMTKIDIDVENYEVFIEMLQKDKSIKVAVDKIIARCPLKSGKGM